MRGWLFPLWVKSTSSSWRSTMVSHGNLIEVAFHLFPTSLIALKSTDIDIILVMDWLTLYQAILDCTTKSMTLTSPAGITIKYWTVGSLSPSAISIPEAELYALEALPPLEIQDVSVL